MDVRASINAESNLALVTGDGEQSFNDDSFFARAPPQAASTVGRTKARRFMPDLDTGSFLDDMPGRSLPSFDLPPFNGARPKVTSGLPQNGSDLQGQNVDWSVVNEWCRENKSDNEMSSQDDRSSMGILNIDEMDLSTNNLLLETPMDEIRRCDTEKESSYVQKKHSDNDTRSDLYQWKQDGSSTSSNSSHDTKQEQPFARSQITTVKKTADLPKSTNPIAAAIRHSLFAKMTIGEEGEDKDASIYEVELQAEELNEIDNDFGEINPSDDSEEEDSKMPVSQSLPKMTVTGDEIKIDSIYLRPGVHGGDQTTSCSLPFLSKVSLFDGGSGSEIDTEDELDQVRKEQGSRHEAAGQASMQDSSRPGLEGGCSDDHSGDKRLPITQRQSAEGDVVASPVPGDGGGGGDGSSGTESDDGRRSHATDSGRGSAGYASNLPSNRQSQSMEYQEQRIRPMGDDLLSEMRFSKYERSTNQEQDDSARILTRYLAPSAPVEDTNPESVMLEDFFASQNQTGDEDDFSPGNRLEASGFNADDALKQAPDSGSNSNPFGQFESSFGSFGLGPGGNRSSGDQSWTQLVGSAGTSISSKPNSLGSEPRTSGDVGPASHHFEQTDYARLGTEERGSVGRSSGSGSTSSGKPSVSNSDVRNFSQSVFDPGLKKSGSIDLTDSGFFKKPFLPAPKAAAVFTKSIAKPKTQKSSSYRSNSDKASGKSSSSSVQTDLNDFKNDLAFRLSLTNEAEEQRQGLKRVPSFGETSIRDLTVNDDKFFDAADALNMLDEDEKQFEEDNVFREDDAMVNVGGSNDSWAYKSVMSIARPSWLEDFSNEEKFVIRISVDSYMRSRNQALGSLDGDENVERPDFGMPINSPNKDDQSPMPLIDESDVFERTSGVGEINDGQNNGNSIQHHQVKAMDKTGNLHKKPGRIASVDGNDHTLTMDSLVQTPNAKPAQPDVCTQRLSDIPERSVVIGEASVKETARPSDVGDKTVPGDKTVSDISQWMKESVDFQTLSARFGASRNLKSQSTSSHLPVRKGSTLEQSNRKNSYNNSTYDKENEDKKNTSRVSNVALLKDRISKPRNESPDNHRNSSSPNPSGRDSIPEEAWSSPNASNYIVPNSGIYDKMEEFQFSEKFQNSDRAVISNDSHRQIKSVKRSLKEQLQLPDGLANLNEDRQKTPPPDGDDGTVSRSQRVSAPRMGLKSYHQNSSVLSDLQAAQGDQRSFAVRDIQSVERTVNGGADQRLSGNPMRNDISRINDSDNDHGYMLGHHIPDGTAYSQRSDFSHMDHKGMSREDVAGVDDVGLAESRGFDMLNRRNDSQTVFKKPQDSNRDESQFDLIDQRTLNHHRNMELQTGSSGKNSPQTGSRENQMLRHENTIKDETHTGHDIMRHESWTQTSLVFKQSVGIQPDNEAPSNNNRDSLASVQSNRDLGFQTINNESFNMTDNMKSQQNIQRIEPERQHLLTKNTSLLKTQFAQDNLKRDYGIAVMDRIYSNTTVPDMRRDSVGQDGNVRMSIESLADWTQLKDQPTMDASQISLTHLDNSHFGYKLPSAHSTPMPVSENAVFSQLRDLTSHHFKTPGRVLLCPVESPGVLKFKNICCVGISQKETLPLKNPTDRWMECVFQVVSIQIDGKPASLDFFPFELRREKVIIKPYETENIDILFLPKMAGAFVAQVQIFSRAVMKSNEPRKNSDSIPVNVTFQAIAEVPWIRVHCSEGSSDVLDFGEMVWGSCAEKTITLENLGQATVPVRLAITSTKGWHCFSFEPEGRMSDVSVISGRHMPQSGHGKTIINISLSGCDDKFNSHSVKVWCRPPEKQCSRLMARQPAEQFSCNIDVDVEIPCYKSQKLASVRLKAVVGVKKLHIQSSLKEISLKAAPRASTESSFKLFNAGNLGLTVWLGFSDHRDVFTATPNSLDIAPGTEAEVKVAFKPLDLNTSRYMSLLLMKILPDGPLFELILQGDVIKKKDFRIMCDCTDMDFGGVAVGKTVVKRYRLMNPNNESVSLTAESRLDDVSLILSPSQTAVGKKKLVLDIPPGGTLPVYVEFSPSNPMNITGKIVMRPENDTIKYVVKVKGYGGLSKLCCSEECTSSTSIQGHPCINIEELYQRTEVVIRNIGVQAALVKVSLYRDLNCSERFTSGRIIVQPSEFTIEAQQQKVLELVTSMSMGEFADQCDSRGLGVVLKLWYKDDVKSAKPHMSDLLIGIIKQKSQDPGLFTTPRRAAYRSSGTSTIPSLTQPLRDTTSYRTSDNINSVSSDSAGYDLWNIFPQELVLYSSRKAAENQMRTFTISNNNNLDLSFEISWPADMLSVNPCRGTLKPREATTIQISPNKKAPKLIDQLPYSGKVSVMANEQVKYLKVQICHDSAGDENQPVRDDSRLVPIPTNVPQPGSSINKLGSLEISKTNVVFGCTGVGKTSEENLVLTNVGPDMLRWIFSSFASPYLRKTADKTKEMFRVSYKVFDFSHQFGKINGLETVQLKLKFMPRSSGTFTQYWDLQISGNSGRSSIVQGQDFIRIHLTGEGYEEPEPQSKTASITKEILQSIPLEKKVCLVHNTINFSPIQPGSCASLKTEFKNEHNEDVKVEVTAPRPPFYVQHQHFMIKRRRYLRFPVEFKPTRPGKFCDTLKFQTVKGDNLIVYLNGECNTEL